MRRDDRTVSPSASACSPLLVLKAVAAVLSLLVGVGAAVWPEGGCVVEQDEQHDRARQRPARLLLLRHRRGVLREGTAIIQPLHSGSQPRSRIALIDVSTAEPSSLIMLIHFSSLCPCTDPAAAAGAQGLGDLGVDPQHRARPHRHLRRSGKQSTRHTYLSTTLNPTKHAPKYAGSATLSSAPRLSPPSAGPGWWLVRWACTMRTPRW